MNNFLDRNGSGIIDKDILFLCNKSFIDFCEKEPDFSVAQVNLVTKDSIKLTKKVIAVSWDIISEICLQQTYSESTWAWSNYDYSVIRIGNVDKSPEILKKEHWYSILKYWANNNKLTKLII